MNYRTPAVEDLPRLTEWVSQDPFHREHLTAKHWVPVLDSKGESEKGVRHLAVCDEEGVIFYLRMTNVMRVEVQFPPAGDEKRVAKGLREAFSLVSMKAKEMGYREMLFDSISKPLVAFFSKLGFKYLENHYKVGLL
ncbi:MAG: hypothetical protein KGL39_53515 [Patescibacteria group bacterium]|nr:hypothetical protein [Patescibacteria group bacterium]